MVAESSGRSLSRRRFAQGAGALGLGLLAACAVPLHTPATRLWRLGMIVTPYWNPTLPDGGARMFVQALADLGYVEGKNITLEYRIQYERDNPWDEWVAELIRLPVDLIFTGNIAAAIAAKRATSTIPIVVSTGDLVGVGLVESLARPGGNVTGLTNISPQLSQKRLELLKETVPGLTRIVMPVDRRNEGEVRDWDAVQDAARLLGLTVQSVEAQSLGDIDGVVEAALRARAEALLVRLVAGLSLGPAEHARLAALTLQNSLPVMGDRRAFAAAGCLMAYGPSTEAMQVRAVTYIDKILKGTKPADLPVEQPTRFDFVINLNTAQALGLTIPPHVLLQATEVIQ